VSRAHCTGWVYVSVQENGSGAVAKVRPARVSAEIARRLLHRQNSAAAVFGCVAPKAKVSPIKWPSASEVLCTSVPPNLRGAVPLFSVTGCSKCCV